MRTILSKTVLSTVAILSLGITSLTSRENQKDNLYNGHFDQKHESQPVIYGNPPAGPNLRNNWGVYITADYILWKPYSGNTDLQLCAVSRGMDFPAAGVRRQSQNVYTDTIISYDFSSGFKVGVGLDLKDGWDVNAEYTWLRPSASQTLKPETHPGAFFETHIPFTPGLQYTYGPIIGKQSLNYNTVTLLAGRDYYVCESLSTKPQIGLLGTWMTFLYSTETSNAVFSWPQFGENISGANPFGPGSPGFKTPTTISFYDMQIKFHQKSSIWSIGPYVGTEFKFFFLKNFALFGNLGGAGLYQHIYVDEDWTVPSTKGNQFSFFDPKSPAPGGSQTYTPIGFNLGEGSGYNRQKQGSYAFKAYLTYTIGLEYGSKFGDDQYYGAIQAGWTSHVYVDWLRFQLGNYIGSMSLGGLDIKLRFDF